MNDSLNSSSNNNIHSSSKGGGVGGVGVGGVGVGIAATSGGSGSGGLIPTATTATTLTSERHPTLVHRKVAILGFRAVGKSSVVNSFVSGSFLESYHPTIESTFHKTIRFRKVHFQTDIVDTAGMVSCRVRRYAFVRFWLFGANCLTGSATTDCRLLVALFHDRMNSLDFPEMRHWVYMGTY